MNSELTRETIVNSQLQALYSSEPTSSLRSKLKELGVHEGLWKALAVPAH